MAVALGAFLGGRASVGRARAAPSGGPERAEAPSPTPSSTEPPGASVVEGDGTLDLGITEPNPAFLVPGGPRAFARWRPALTQRIRPAYYRLVVEWDKLARPDGTGFDVAQPTTGCLRDVRPCAPYRGLRAQFAALKRAQEAAPGRFQPMVVFTYTPAALAARPHGCERARTAPRSRPPRPDAIGMYRATVRAVLAEARAQGVDVRYWSPWNEPNHPYFSSPQRTRCTGAAPSAAVRPYVRLARAMQAELDAAPGEQQLVLGETAAFTTRRANATTVQELIAGLPRGLVCRSPVYGQHAYLGGKDPVGAVARALRRFHCPRTPQIWITETGADVGRSDERSACLDVHRRLVRWYRDPRVTAAFQYTLRQDDRFPTGLVATSLARAFPTLGEWEAWGARRDAQSPPPRPACG